MALNLTQKLLQAHLAKPAELVPGNEIELTVDQTLTHDINAVMSYLAFEAWTWTDPHQAVRQLH